MESKKDKIIIVTTIVILIMLIFNFIETIYQLVDYEERKDAGNDRWLQVENRILQTEEKVKELEEEIKNWKQ